MSHLKWILGLEGFYPRALALPLNDPTPRTGSVHVQGTRAESMLCFRSVRFECPPRERNPESQFRERIGQGSGDSAHSAVKNQVSESVSS